MAKAYVLMQTVTPVFFTNTMSFQTNIVDTWHALSLF